MKTLYLECGMGAAGDMLMAALSELTDAEAFVEKMNSLGIPGVKVVRQDAVTCGIHGTHMQVTIDGEEEITEDVRLAAAEQGEMLTVSDEHHHDHEHEHEHHHDHDHEHETTSIITTMTTNTITMAIITPVWQISGQSLPVCLYQKRYGRMCWQSIS